LEIKLEVVLVNCYTANGKGTDSAGRVCTDVVTCQIVVYCVASPTALFCSNSQLLFEATPVCKLVKRPSKQVA